MFKKIYLSFLLLFLILGSASVIYLGFSSQEATILETGEENLPPSIPSNFVKNFPLSFSNPVTQFSINGQINLTNDNAFLRVVMIDDQDQEFLVFETYSALAANPVINLDDACEETCLLDNITPKNLKIEGNSANFKLTNIDANSNQLVMAKSVSSINNEINQEKIRALNRKNQATGKRWLAGETDISKLSYSEKKKLFGIPEGQPLPNWQGFEYYKSGIFEIEPISQVPANPILEIPNLTQ